jgi:hypothetical protein
LQQTFRECKQEEEVNREGEEMRISVRRRRRRGRRMRMRMTEKY